MISFFFIFHFIYGDSWNIPPSLIFPPTPPMLKSKWKGGKSVVEMCCQDLQGWYPQFSAHISVILLFLFRWLQQTLQWRVEAFGQPPKKVTNNWPNVQSTWITYSLGKKYIYGLWGVREFTSLFQFFQKDLKTQH